MRPSKKMETITFSFLVFGASIIHALFPSPSPPLPPLPPPFRASELPREPISLCLLVDKRAIPGSTSPAAQGALPWLTAPGRGAGARRRASFCLRWDGSCRGADICDPIHLLRVCECILGARQDTTSTCVSVRRRPARGGDDSQVARSSPSRGSPARSTRRGRRGRVGSDRPRETYQERLDRLSLAAEGVVVSAF